MTQYLVACLAAFLFLANTNITTGAANEAGAYQWLSTQGTQIVDEQGDPVILKGCNVGNWLLLEMWMLRIDHNKFHDQYEFEANLANRFGEAEKDRLMEVYRENWITPRDFKIIKSFGFNVIRLPFNYRLLEDDDKPFELKPDAFKWLDRAIEMAEAEGLYVILDMHGVPGGQSIDHPTGRSGQNKLWGDPIYAKRTANLWKHIANRYKDRASIAGYDLINEPYNDFKGDIRPRLREIFVEIYDAVRAVDKRHIVFAPAPLWGGHGFYGNTKENGWTNVAFTEHHYPGLFGSDPSMKTHGNFIYQTMPAKQAELEAAEAPLYIGEWNPVFERLGGGDLMRRYFDEYGKRGWAATIWSYKILQVRGGNIHDNWEMVSNAEPLNRPDFATASSGEIEAFFKWFSTMEYVIDEPMREALTRPDPVAIEFPEPAPRLTEPPHADKLVGWTATDIGGALTGGQQVLGDNALLIYGGGDDIWNNTDQFRLISQEVPGDFTITTTLASLADTNGYAKAGLMARADTSTSSAHVMVHVFPSGTVALGWRSAAGGTMLETQADNHAWPIHLRLTRRGNTYTGEYSTDGAAWQTVGEPVEVEALGKRPQVGMAVLSHNNQCLTSARFESIKLDRAATR
jgi:glucan 1,3-beta-glucosidase